MINITIPNLPKFQKALSKWPEQTAKELKDALTKSILEIERQSKLLTPVDTGRLRASLGGGSYKGGGYGEGHGIKIEKTRASIGSDVKYAAAVHARTPFLTGGVHAAMPKINEIFTKMVDKILSKIAKDSK